MSEALVVPDFTEAIIGWRIWELWPHRREGHWSVCSASRRVMWPAREPFGARCMKGGPGGSHGWPRFLVDIPATPTCRRPPGEGCSCGAYAFNDAEEAIKLCYKLRRTVFGSVALWGTVIRHQRGYRAQRAYPLTFGLRTPSVEQQVDPAAFDYVLDRYGCGLDDRSDPAQLRWDL